MSTPAPAKPDPAAWMHNTSGARVAHPFDQDSPQGGYTYSPRPGYSDHEDRYLSTRSAEHAARMKRADALAAEGEEDR